MAGKSDQFKRITLTAVTSYSDAGADIVFDGPMHSFLFSNRHTTAHIFISWKQGGEDAICLAPGQSVVMNGRPMTSVLSARRDAAAAVGDVFLDISASGIGEFHT